MVGYDFGYKPAFSVAVVPKPGVLQQETDDLPTTFCHDAWGDVLQAAISGVTICLNCFTIVFGPGLINDVSITVTGLNGAWPAINWNGFRWTGVIGTVHVSYFSSTDGTCTTPAGTADFDINLNVDCSNNVLTSVVALAEVFDPTVSNAVFFDFFISDGTGSLGSVLNNTYVPAGCGTFTSVYQFGYDGSVTLNL